LKCRAIETEASDEQSGITETAAVKVSSDSSIDDSDSESENESENENESASTVSSGSN
jgi:hypothetical protein